MRPNIVRYEDPETPANYPWERAAEVIGGTIPAIDPATTVAILNASRGVGLRIEKGFLHITLSAPEGLNLSREAWREVIVHTIRRLGLDPARHAWIAVRHSDKNCDHIHCVVSRTDFFGRPSPVENMTDPEVLCAEIHREIAVRLCLEYPDYPILSPAPRLASRAPKRRGNNPEAAKLHAAVGQILLEDRPATLAQLEVALEATPFRIKDLGRGPTFLRANGKPVAGKLLKPDLTTAAILARIAHVGIVKRALAYLSEHRFVSQFLSPAARATLSQLAKEAKNDQANPLRSAPSGKSAVRPVAFDHGQAGAVDASARSPFDIPESGDGRGPAGSGDGSGRGLGKDHQHQSASGSGRGAPDRDGRAPDRDGRNPHADRQLRTSDEPAPALTLGDWVADLLGAALKIASAPKLILRQRVGRATVRFGDATRLEVYGTTLTLGRVGAGDLADPRGFASELEKSDLGWRIDPALRSDLRIKARPAGGRPIVIVARLDAETIKAARAALELDPRLRSPLFLSAADKAIGAFPDAPFIWTGPRDDEAETLVGRGREVIRASQELSEAEVADPDEHYDEPGF